MLDTQKRGRVAAITAVSGGALAAVTIGTFAATGGSTANAAFTGCGFGYSAETGYGYQAGYGVCPTPSPSPTKPATSPSPSPTAVPVVCNPNGKQHTPDVQLDGGAIKKGQRKGLTARCLRPNRIVQVYAIDSTGKSIKFAYITVNKFGTVRVFYKAKNTGPVTISFVGAAFDGKILRKKFATTIKPA